MNLKRIFRRLDLQLSLLLGGIVALWFLSFIISIHYINLGKAEKEVALEKERVLSRVRSDATRLLNDILLDHTDALNLSVSALQKDLGLSWIAITTQSGRSFSVGEAPKSKVASDFEFSFPIEFEGQKYGTIALIKPLASGRGVAVFDLRWVIGIALVMAVIFIIIRVFINRQIVKPINTLINHCTLEKGLVEPCQITPKSVEIEGLVHSFNQMKRTIHEYQEKVVKAERQAALFNMASQVAHDIRSPLTALALVNEDLSELPEDKRILVRSAVERIQDIANNLLQENRNRNQLGDEEKDDKFDRFADQLISSHVDAIVSEKRMQFRSRLNIEIRSRIDADSYGVFGKIQPTEFKRVLANLIDNSVEAIGRAGEVEVSVRDRHTHVEVLVRDTGAGIPKEVLPRLAEQGFSYGKQSGSGLGLFHAKTTLESWGGAVSIESSVGSGTKITLKLSKSAPPDWFVPELKLNRGMTIVVVDDDLSIHQIWQKRLEGLSEGLGITLLHFSTITELEVWHETHKRKKVLHLIDYELIGQPKNGLEAIESLSIEKTSILVTSRYEEERVLSNCLRLGVRMIPKALAGFVPVHMSGSKRVDVVLIDDDPITRLSWKSSANRHNKVLGIFQSPKRFFSAAKTMDRKTPVYIDSNLGNGIRGEEVAKQIRDLGFESVFLTTGYSPEKFGPMPWIVDIVGKEPPWTRSGPGASA